MNIGLSLQDFSSARSIPTALHINQERFFHKIYIWSGFFRLQVKLPSVPMLHGNPFDLAARTHGDILSKGHIQPPFFNHSIVDSQFATVWNGERKSSYKIVCYLAQIIQRTSILRLYFPKTKFSKASLVIAYSTRITNSNSTHSKYLSKRLCQYHEQCVYIIYADKASVPFLNLLDSQAFLPIFSKNITLYAVDVRNIYIIPSVPPSPNFQCLLQEQTHCLQICLSIAFILPFLGTNCCSISR